MKHWSRRTLLIVVLLAALLVVPASRCLWRHTGVYPQMGPPSQAQPVQIEGIDFAVEQPHYVLGRGYAMRWALSKRTERSYALLPQQGHCEVWLERQIEGQWYTLVQQLEPDVFPQEPTVLDRNVTGFEASFTQKYQGYGTRLEPGHYRLALCLRDEQTGQEQVIAESFWID